MGGGGVAAVTALRELLWSLIEALMPWGPWTVLLGVGALVGAFAGVVHGLLEGPAALEARRHVAAAALDIRLGVVEPGVLPRRSLALAARSARWMLWTVPAVVVGLPVVVLAMVELYGAYGIEAAQPLTVVATLAADAEDAAGGDVQIAPSPELVVERGQTRVVRFAHPPTTVALRVGDEVLTLSPRGDGGVDGQSRGWAQALDPGRGRSLPASSAFMAAHIVSAPTPVERQPGGWPWEVPFLVGALLAGFAGAWLGRRSRELVVGPIAVEAQAER